VNIFVLDTDPRTCAQYHCNKHVVKMVLETAQILSTVLVAAGEDAPYRPTHKKHPCVLWAGAAQANYAWLHRLGLELGLEYTHRYGKKHKSHTVIEELPAELSILPPGLTPYALCMPDEFKSDDVVDSYRAYYLSKPFDMKWTGRPTPWWAVSAV
jgi:hypothetical protein